MSRLIDAHLHFFETRDLGTRWKNSYDIWEYGINQVAFSRYEGDVADAKEALTSSGYSQAIFANVFFPRIEIDFALQSLGPDAGPEERQRLVDDVKGSLPERMYARNRWGCESVADDDRFGVLAAIDPSVVSPDDNVKLVSELFAEYRIKGIKIHPPLQSFWPDDPRMEPVYRLCEDLGLIVLSHTGSTRGPNNYGAPLSFAPVIRKFPKLKLQLAHLGGGRWRETVALAEEFSQVNFDLCEVIEWIGSPNAPSFDDFARMIKAIGPGRVLLGTDFPWYDLDSTAKRLSDLPLLSPSEKEAIAGENAAELYDLPS